MAPILLVPGLLCDFRVWTAVQNRLPGTTFVVDLTAANSLDDMAKAILVETAEPCLLVGFSMGAMASLIASCLVPEKIAGLVLIASHAEPESPERRANRERQIAAAACGQLDKIVDEQLCPAYFGHRDLVASAADRALTRDMALKQGPEIFRRHSAALMNRPPLSASRLPAQLPFAVIAGAEDRVVPIAWSKAMAEQTGQASFHLLPGCGHMAPLESPDAIARVITDQIGRAIEGKRLP